MEVVRHLGRTLLHIAVLAAALAGIVWAAIFLSLPPVSILIGIALLLGGYIYGSARWHAYWAPISKTVYRKKWNHVSGQEMETVVEKAIVQAGISVRSETLRVSVYTSDTKRRIARKLVGDDAEFLGFHGIGLWFYISDGFHARRDGLVCIDMEDASWIFHIPASEIGEVETRQKSVITFEKEAGELEQIDLREQEANL